ncbi:hypothetical protein [Dactylosporangium sp. CA-092794]|uniref:hypothetical protein n=1 Tax=Dactylosporangium sp. CA-092794 TaxID=3239929 RepID=UPI003D8BC29E
MSAYFIGSMVGSAVGRAVRNERARAEEAHWHSPMSRLGRCGVTSLRWRKATEEVMDAIDTAAGGRWRRANGVAGFGVQCFLVFGAGRAAVVWTVIGDDYVAAVQGADSAARAVEAVRAFVCRADLADEPRDLPAPSGRSVTVSGLPWLAGLLRTTLSDGEALVPEGLEARLAAGERRLLHQWNADCAALQSCPPQWWWYISDLYLDDGLPEPLDLVMAGPGGVFVCGFGSGVADVGRQAQRVRGYLPMAEVLPVIVDERVEANRFGPADAAGLPIAWLHPDRLLDFVLRTQRRGLAAPQISTLNFPAPDWYRRLDKRLDGTVEVSWGWTV